MSEQKKPESWLDEELARELTETVITLARLGVTLAGMPIALLPRQQREHARQLADELLRVGSSLPRTVSAMLEEESEGGNKPREDLGSRLRREQRRVREEEARRAAAQSAPAADDGASPMSRADSNRPDDETTG